MLRRYALILADRSGAGRHHVTIGLRSALLVAATAIGIPALIGLGAKWSTRAEVAQLRTAKLELEVENSSYRAATGELTAQIQSLENVINDLGSRSTLDPAQARAMQRLPAV